MLFSESPVGNTPSDNNPTSHARSGAADISRAARVADFSIFSPPENFDTPDKLRVLAALSPIHRLPRYNYVMPMIVILFTLLPRCPGYLFRTRNTWRVFASRVVPLALVPCHFSRRSLRCRPTHSAFDHVSPSDRPSTRPGSQGRRVRLILILKSNSNWNRIDVLFFFFFLRGGIFFLSFLLFFTPLRSEDGPVLLEYWFMERLI